MGYDSKFFAQYAAYLVEPSVRKSHDRVFQIFSDQEDKLDVLDLGCGMGEFPARVAHRKYVGVDREDHTSSNNFIKADYTNLSFLELLPFQPNLVVSLFSIEACLPASERYQLYEELFQRLSDVNLIVTAGFYYESKKDQETVGEAGGIVSYQSNDNLYDHASEVFDESRILLRTPSKMFGSDVVEVWKVLERR